MPALDLKKELKHLYNPSSKEITFVDVPTMNFIKVDGAGDPNTSQEFQDAIGVIFSLSYTLKFKIKKAEPTKEYAVMPMEGLWWSEDMSSFDMALNKALWKWTVMIMQPEFVTSDLFDQAVEEVRKKKDLPGLAKARFESYHEGPSAQIMHIGPFSTEGPTVAKIHEAIHNNGARISGLHHEIYLNDFRKVSPEKMKTVVRQPYK